MARKALYKHATQVNTSTYPDDGTSPVGSNEWNADPDSQGMLGFAPATATITIASGVATVTDTITVVAAESSTTDTLDKLAIANTSQYDLVYLFADAGDTITLANTSSPSADGQIKTISDSNETLSTTVPTILIRKGNYWYGYGGGVVNAISDVGDVTITSNSAGEILKWSGSAWINQTLAETGIAAASHTQAASTITDFDTEVANNSAVTANTAKTGITSGQASSITANTTSIDSINSYAGTELYVKKWSGRSAAAANSWRGITWSPSLGLFCAISNDGTTSNNIMTSPDGITWTSRTSPATNTWESITWAPSLGLFCAVGQGGTGNRVMTSPDGTNWTSRTSAADNSWKEVAWSEDLTLFIAVSTDGTNRIMKSANGTSWSSVGAPEANQWTGITWSSDLTLFCGVSYGGSNRVMTSPDGITWTSRTAAVANSWNDVTWSPELGLFCAVSASGTGDRVMTSPDGINWTSRTSAADSSWYEVEWAPELGLFCAVSFSGTIMTSPDGITWTSRTSPETNRWNSIVWSPELYKFCAVSTNGTNRVMTTTYSDRLNANTSKVTNATHTGDVTGSGALTIADNAVTLAKMAAGTDGNLITYDTNGDPAYVATGSATQILTSNGAGAAPTFQAPAGGGATVVHAFSNTTTTTYTGTASSFGTVGAGDRDIYIKKIDANNEGVFTKIWKNGAAVEVQIA